MKIQRGSFTMSKSKQKNILEVLIILALILAILGFSVIKLGLAPQVPIMAAIALLILWGKMHRESWYLIHQGITKGISTGLIPMIIFILIGALIGVWIAAGIIPSMMVLGFEIVNPHIFIPSVFVICSVVGVAVGSAFTVTSTVGIAFLGIGLSMGFSPALIAGAVISGAVFGDKMSPLSDSTNLSAAIAEVDLFLHIRNLMWTTIPAFFIALIGFAILGTNSQEVPLEKITEISQLLQSQFTISWWSTVPVILIFVCAQIKLPAIPTLFISIAVGIIMLLATKTNVSIKEVADIIQNGYVSKTDNATIDTLLTHGGIQSMMWSISLIILALALGGLLVELGVISTLMNLLVRQLNTRGKLILTTALSCIGINLLVGEQYLSIILPGNAFKEQYAVNGLHPLALSRVLEDSGAVVNSLVPWSVSGVFMAATLGVPTLDYLPFAFFCLLCPIITVIAGFTNIGIKKLA